MQSIVIVGMLTYSLSYLITEFLFDHYLRESNNKTAATFDFSNRRYRANAINLVVAVIAMAIIYFSGVS